MKWKVLFELFIQCFYRPSALVNFLKILNRQLKIIGQQYYRLLRIVAPQFHPSCFMFKFALLKQNVVESSYRALFPSPFEPLYFGCPLKRGHIVLTRRHRHLRRTLEGGVGWLRQCAASNNIINTQMVEFILLLSGKKIMKRFKNSISPDSRYVWYTYESFQEEKCRKKLKMGKNNHI